MRIARLQFNDGSITYAVEREDCTFTRIEGEVLGDGWRDTGESVAGKLLAPVAPRVIFCTGLNYRRHAEETHADIPQWPVLFMKSPTAVQNPGDPIELPRHLNSEAVDYECELAIVIGKSGKNLKHESAMDHVLGFTCANDVSARDWQVRRGGSQWCRGKTFDTFCPLGPVIVTPDEVGNPNALSISTTVNGEKLQDCNTNDMIFNVVELLVFLSGSTTLPAGAVILTGTPHGVGVARNPKRWLHPGDTVAVEIEKIGQLRNPVVEEAL